MSHYPPDPIKYPHYQKALTSLRLISFSRMVALQMAWHSSDRLEMQKAYMIKSPQKGLMKAVIGFQSFLGLTGYSLYHSSEH